MSVNGINGSTPTQHATTVGTQSGSPGVGTQTGAPEPTEDNVPLVGSAEETPTGDGSIPSPDGDPAAYAEHLAQTSDDYEDLMALREQLEFLAERGDAKASELITKIDAALQSLGLGNERALEDFQNDLDEYGDYLPDSDFDGDGIKNKSDADIDGDSITNEAEAANGTNAYNTDTDGDGITDYGELWMKQHNYDYTWMDPNNPDANSNGILDGAELPSSITVDNNGVPIRVGAQPGTPGSGTTGSTSTTSAPSLNWGPPGAGASSAGWGDTVPAGEGEVVVNLAGENIEVSTSADGNNMIVTNKDTGETITFEGYKEKKIYFEGTLGAMSTNNFSAGNMNGVDTNGDGYADSGVHFASGMNTASITNNYDPFNGSLPIDEAASTEEEIVYDASGGAAGTFALPESMGGNVVEITFEGNDAIVTVKDGTGGDAIKKFRIKDGKTQVESGAISFQGTDGDDFFYTEGKVTIHAGKGNDMVTAGAGSQVYGEDGNDIIELAGTAAGGLLDGGAGDDLLSGSDGVDSLVGGSGNDAAYSGASENDSFDMGTGDDIAIVSNTATDATYTIQMGGGTDMTNSTNSAVIDPNGDGTASETGVDVRMDDLDGLRAFMEGKLDDAAGASLEALGASQDLQDQAAQMAAGTVKDAFLAYLMKRKGNAETDFGSDHSGGYGSDADGSDGVPPPPPPAGP